MSEVPIDPSELGDSAAEESKSERLTNPLKKVTAFVEETFNGEIPKEVQERLELLPERITISSEELRMTQEEAGIGGREARVARGVYIPSKDRIVLADDASSNEIIHEALHFVSCRPMKEGEPIRRGLQVVSGNIAVDGHMNEGVTVLFSFLAEWEIPITKTLAALDVWKGYQAAKRTGDLRIAQSYLNAVTQVFRGVFALGLEKHDSKEILKRMPLLRNIARSYLLADPEELWRTIDENVRRRRWQTPASNEIRTSVRIPAPEYVNEVKSTITADAAVLQRHGYLRRKDRKYAGKFVDAIRKDKANYVFPEESDKLVDYTPGMTIGNIRIEPGLHISTGMTLSLLNSEEGRRFLGDGVQRAVFYIWQGYKLANSTEKQPIDDSQFFGTPVIQEYIARHRLEEQWSIDEMARGVLHTTKSDAETQRIMNLYQERTTPEVARIMSHKSR